MIGNLTMCTRTSRSESWGKASCIYARTHGIKVCADAELKEGLLVTSTSAHFTTAPIHDGGRALPNRPDAPIRLAGRRKKKA